MTRAAPDRLSWLVAAHVWGATPGLCLRASKVKAFAVQGVAWRVQERIRRLIGGRA